MNKKIILILTIISLCLLLTSPVFAKEKVKIKVTTEDSPFTYTGYIVIKMETKDGTPIKKAGTLHYNITDENGNYQWAYGPFKKKVVVKVNNGKYKVKVKFDGDSKYKKAKLTKTVTVKTDGSLSPYNYYDSHNYGENLLYDEYIYDNYWDEEIYDDAETYDGEGY